MPKFEISFYSPKYIIVEAPDSDTASLFAERYIDQISDGTWPLVSGKFQKSDKNPIHLDDKYLYTEVKPSVLVNETGDPIWD